MRNEQLKKLHQSLLEIAQNAANNNVESKKQFKTLCSDNTTIMMDLIIYDLNQSSPLLKKLILTDAVQLFSTLLSYAREEYPLVDNDYDTPWHIACASTCSPEIYKLLSRHFSCLVNHRNSVDDTPLLLAIQHRNMRALDWLFTTKFIHPTYGERDYHVTKSKALARAIDQSFYEAVVKLIAYDQLHVHDMKKCIGFNQEILEHARSVHADKVEKNDITAPAAFNIVRAIDVYVLSMPAGLSASKNKQSFLPPPHEGDKKPVNTVGCGCPMM